MIQRLICLYSLLPTIVVVVLANSQSGECSETKIRGGIYFNETWTPEKSPYVLAGNAKVGKGAIVRVLPGVHIIGNGHKITVDGTMVIDQGTVQEVHFVPGKSDRGDLAIRSSTVSGGSVFAMEHFRGHKGSVNMTDSTFTDIMPIYLFYPPRNMTIARNVFERCGGISVGTEGIVVRIENNVFFKQTTDYAVQNWARYPFVISQDESTDGKNYWYAMDMKVRHNSFLCADRVALRLSEGYNDAYMSEASHNYFGTTDENVIASMIRDKHSNVKIKNEIKYRPVLQSKHDDTPTRPDFVC